MSQVWLSWENHRRSKELARLLDIPFVLIRPSKNPLLKYWWPALKTVATLLATRADTVVVQNPSLVLTVMACFLKPFKGYRLVQDLHSYFSTHIHTGVGLRGKVYRVLSRYCIPRADLTVVTNPALKNVIDSLGGRGFVLQDAIPALPAGEPRQMDDGAHILFSCTYAEDEPIDEVFAAGRLLDGVAHIHVTGRIPKGMKTWNLPPNVHLTGFLSEADYLQLLRSADAVLGLTTREHTLLCCAYEGLAARKPLVLSGMEALKGYFGEGMVYVKNDATSIAEGIRRLLDSKAFFDRHVPELVSQLERDWAARFEEFRRFVRQGGPAENAPAPAAAAGESARR